MIVSNLPKQTLPTLQAIIDELKPCKELNLECVTFVCVQHLLYTTIDLVKALVILGAKPGNIHIMGKIYSTCPKVVEQLEEIGVIYYHSSQPRELGCFEEYFDYDIANMWCGVRSHLASIKSNSIIVLDDGGKCIVNIPKALSDNHEIYAIEQTSSGICRIKKNNIPLPVVDVAFSATKQLIESRMIAKAVVVKLSQFLSLHNNKFTCGVVGLGVVGQAVVEKLLSLNHKVIIYDKLATKYDKINEVDTVDSVQSLLEKTEYIFGCTGDDITTFIDIDQLHGVKTLISCSSQDVEFKSLLTIIRDNTFKDIVNVLDHIEFPVKNGIIRIFRGGYPVNLDNSGESVPAQDIQLTRGLLLGGIIQALFQLIQKPKQDPRHYMLHPKIQKFMVQEFIKDQPAQSLDNSLAKNFSDEEWIKASSGGEYVDNDLITTYFTKAV
jgi:S-adenosylhomocysteine hydrolase